LSSIFIQQSMLIWIAWIAMKHKTATVKDLSILIRLSWKFPAELNVIIAILDIKRKWYEG